MGIGVLMCNKTLNKIDASLKHGQFFTGGLLIFFYSFIGFCCIMPISTVVFLFLVYYGKEAFDENTTITFICSNIGCFFIICGLIYVLYRNNKLKRNILLWLEDAVELTAKTTTIDRFRTLGHPIAETTLQVEFCIDHHKKVMTSIDETKKNHWYKTNGSYKVLTKYADQTIKILYSPKFEQVLILKKKYNA